MSFEAKFGDSKLEIGGATMLAGLVNRSGIDGI